MLLMLPFGTAWKRLICLSTDKAVYPINAMGMSKAMMEKIMVLPVINIVIRILLSVAHVMVTF